ncbi:MAG: hypothetical protein H7Y12_09970 [Sphingobacteriaceae bacterium]|nr:hypothetical protein [Cytophagaceae bacterium]
MADQAAYTNQLARVIEGLGNPEAFRNEAPQLLDGLIDTLQEKGFSEIADQLEAFQDVLAEGDPASIGQALQNLGKLTSDAAPRVENMTAQRVQELAETLTRLGDEYAGKRTTSVAE